MFKPILGEDILDYGNPLTQGLVGCWLMNEASGDRVADLSGNGYTGTFVNTLTWVHDNEGLAVDFASGDYILVNDDKIIGGLDNWSIVAFGVTTTAATVPGGRALYCERASSGNDILKLECLANIATDSALFTYRNDGGYLRQVSGSTTINDGLPHTIGATFDGSIIRLYVDGLEDNTGVWASNNNFTDSGLEVRIGSDKGDVNSKFIGSLRGVHPFTKTLTAEQMFQLHADPYQIFDTGFNPAIFGSVAAGRLSRYHGLDGLGGFGQQTFNPLR